MINNKYKDPWELAGKITEDDIYRMGTNGWTLSPEIQETFDMKQIVDVELNTDYMPILWLEDHPGYQVHYRVTFYSIRVGFKKAEFSYDMDHQGNLLKLVSIFYRGQEA